MYVRGNLGALGAEPERREVLVAARNEQELQGQLMRAYTGWANAGIEWIGLMSDPAVQQRLGVPTHPDRPPYNETFWVRLTLIRVEPLLEALRPRVVQPEEVVLALPGQSVKVVSPSEPVELLPGPAASAVAVTPSQPVAFPPAAAPSPLPVAVAPAQPMAVAPSTQVVAAPTAEESLSDRIKAWLAEETIVAGYANQWFVLGGLLAAGFAFRKRIGW